MNEQEKRHLVVLGRLRGELKHLKEPYREDFEAVDWAIKTISATSKMVDECCVEIMHGKS